MQKHLISFLSLLALISFSAHADDVFVPLDGGVSKIAKHLKQVHLDETQSCLGDYLQRRHQIGTRMALGTLGIPADPLVAGAGMVTGAAIGAVTSTPGTWAAFGAVLGGTVLGGLVAGGGELAVLVTGETIGLVHLIETDHLIEIVYEARVGQGKHLATFVKKLRQHYAGAVSNFSDADIAARIAAYDVDRSLCNGKLVPARRFKKGKKLMQRLATSSELMQGIAGR